ncbi:hypothetical protein PGT21_008348 [Puccinia graminis f. sp. tritici]|uniref:Uncharacterized protein n=1 Tax=Puccinia graminis f. sp. tritici TaxID=56615 RepID=A0A5B0LUI6_PUCGR|nr:hypothetical protein PGT21_008182 [Puccinia graminis f. sp. tritici]KAA1067529.1 hypothetical protein PGT21_008348 [Puccinia graminis f. sp. tritici]KAA1092224.1 hypothetical protein PGTUg99_023043 [Puccinia graminis f. sp. tritici]
MYVCQVRPHLRCATPAQHPGLAEKIQRLSILQTLSVLSVGPNTAADTGCQPAVDSVTGQIVHLRGSLFRCVKSKI